MGKLHYDPEDEYVCSELDESVYNKTVAGTNDFTPFYVARRGNCSFVTKIRSMENIGIAVGIVVDNTAETVEDVLMSDDGTGGGIRIPSMLIGQKDGEKLISWLKNATPEDLAQLVVLCEFVMPYNQDDKVYYDYWYTSSSDRALDFLEDFHHMEKQLHGLAEFEPHFVFWECTDCDSLYTSNDCFGAGKYCALEPGNLAIKGQEIVLEDLRQLCLWKSLKATNQTDLWWNYIEKVHSTCFNVINEDCSQRAHTKLGLSWTDTNKCVRESFTGKDWIAKTVSNELIDKEVSYWRQFGTTVYPSVVVNKKTYRGQIEPLGVYNALCAGFKNPPQ